MEESTTPIFDSLSDIEKDIVNYYMFEKRKKVWAYINGYHPGGEEGVDYNYDSCRTESAKFFAKPNIKAAIKELFAKIWDERKDLNGRVIDELEALAFSNIDEVFDLKKDIDVKDLSKEDTRAIKSVKIRREATRQSKDSKGEDIEIKTDVVQIDIHDKKAALSEIADINGLKRIQVEHTGPKIVYLDDQDKEI